MAPFPDNLPPYGLDPVTKLLIYFGILYVLSTAFTTWLITRRRSFPKPEKVSTPSDSTTTTRTVEVSRGVTETLSFDDTKDNLASLKIEIQGAEAALEQLQRLKGELSTTAFEQLSAEYNSRVGELSTKMNDMLQSNIESTTGEIDQGISDDEMEAIEADLEKQLMDLNEDDFLARRPKKSMDEIFADENVSSQPSITSTPSMPSQPKATPPAKPQPKASEPKRVPMPPPPKKGGKPATPAAKASTPSAQLPSQPAATPPKPSGESNEEKKVPMPPPPKKMSAPPPPSSGASSPQAATPAAQPPKSNQPLSAAQPMKVQTEDDDGMFAKSTSIAALRMDMLRELARLKKLIPEDQEKDQ